MAQESSVSLGGLGPRCQEGRDASGGSGEESVPCLFQILEAACSPWLVVPPPSSQSATQRLPSSLTSAQGSPTQTFNPQYLLSAHC